MFNINDKIAFHLVIYTSDKKQPTPIISLPKGIDMNFKLPENTSFIELKEFKEELGIPSLSTIRSFFVETGKETTIGKLCDTLSGTDTKVKFVPELDDKHLKVEDKIIVEESPSMVMVKRKVNDNDLIFKSIKELEIYIRRLTVALDSFKQKEEAVKRILTQE